MNQIRLDLLRLNVTAGVEKAQNDGQHSDGENEDLAKEGGGGQKGNNDRVTVVSWVRSIGMSEQPKTICHNFIVSFI